MNSKHRDLLFFGKSKKQLDLDYVSSLNRKTVGIQEMAHSIQEISQIDEMNTLQMTLDFYEEDEASKIKDIKEAGVEKELSNRTIRQFL